MNRVIHLLQWELRCKLHNIFSLAVHTLRFFRAAVLVCALAVCGSAAWGTTTTYTSDTTLDNSTIASGDEIIVNSGVTLTLTNNFYNNGTIINYGTILATKITSNTGTITNSGTITVTNDITSSGTINNTGTITAGTSITNSGTIYNSGTISAGNGSITNTGTITNTGNLNGGTGGVSNSGSGTIDNDGGSVGGYSISYTPTPKNGSITTVTVSNSSPTFSSFTISFAVTNSSSATSEFYTVTYPVSGSDTIKTVSSSSYTSVAASLSAAANSATFTIEYPATVDTGDGLVVTVAQGTTSIGSVSYTASSESTDYYWAGGTDSSWSTAGNWVTTSGGSTIHTVAPSKTSDIYIDTDGLTYYPVSSSYVSVSSITMTEGMLSLTGGVKTTGDLSLGGTAVMLGGDVTAVGTLTVSASTVTLAATTEFQSDVVLGGNVEFATAGYALSFAKKVNGEHELTISGSGAVVFAGTVGTTTALSSFTSGTGTITCTGGRIKTSGNQVYNGPLNGPSSGLLELRTDGTVSQTASGVITAHQLILTPTTTGKGTFNLGDAANMITTLAAGNSALVPLSITVANAQSLSSGTLTSVATSDNVYTGIYASGAVSVATTSGAIAVDQPIVSTGGAVSVGNSGSGSISFGVAAPVTAGTTATFTGSVSLGTDVTVTGTTVTITGAITGASNDLTITGNAVFGDGTTTAAASDIDVLLVSGTTGVAGQYTLTATTQSYTGAVTVSANGVLSGSTGAVTFNDAFTNNGMFSASSGNTVFNGSADFSVGTFVANSGTVYIHNTSATATSFVTCSNQQFNNVYISGNVNFTANGAIAIAGTLSAPGDATVVSFIGSNFTVTFNGTGTITADSMNLTRASSTAGVIGTFEFDCNTTCTNILMTHSGTSVLVDSSKKLTAGTYTYSASSSTPKTTLTVNGELAVTNTLDLAANATTGCKLTVGTGGNVTATKLTTTGAYSNDSDTEIINNAGAITATTITIPSGTVTTNSGTIATTTGDFTLNGQVSNTGTVSTGSGSITNTYTTAETIGGTVSVTAAGGSLVNNSGVQLTVSSFVMTAAATLYAQSGNITVSALTNTTPNALTVLGSTVTLPANANVGAFTVGDGTTATTAVLSGATTASSVTITSNGSLQAGTTATDAYAISVGGNWSNAGTFTANNGTVIFTDDAAISGATSFYNLSCTTAGKTLTINDSSAVTNTLTLQGASGSRLTIAGTGSIKLTSSQTTGSYISVGSSVKLYDSTGATLAGCKYSAVNSVPSAGVTLSDFATVLANGWNLTSDSAFIYTWTAGANTTAWSTAANWNTGIVPGVSGVTVNVDVSIPVVTAAKYPVVDSTYSIRNLTIGAVGATTPSITLNSYALTVTGTLTNYGTVVYEDSNRITDGTNPINDVAQGTVEYKTGTGTITSFGATDYYDLLVSSGTWSASDEIVVANKATVSGGDASFNNGSGNQSTTVNTAAFTTTGIISFGNASGDSFTVTGTGAELSLSGNPIYMLAGTLSATDGIVIGKDSTLVSDTKFASTTTLSDSVTISGAYVTTFSDALGSSVSGTTRVLTIKDGSLVNSSTVSDFSVVFTETTTNTTGVAQSFTPSPSSYVNVTVNKTNAGTSGSFTVADQLTTQTLTLTKANGMTFNYSVIVSGTATSSLSDTAAAGAITFNAGVQAIGAVTFVTTSAVTLGNDGTADVCTFTNGVTHTAGATSLACALTTTNAAVTFGGSGITTTVAKTSTVTTGSGAVQIGGTLNYAGDYTLTIGDGTDDTSPVTVADITATTANTGTLAVANTNGTVSLAGNIGAASSYLKTLSFTKTGGTVTLADGKTSCITTLTTNSDSYDIVINNTSLTVTSATTFTNTGALTLGNDGTTDACTFTNGVTHIVGATSLACTLATTNAAVTFGGSGITTTVAKTSTVTTGSGAVQIGGTLNYAGDYTLTIGDGTDDTSPVTVADITATTANTGTLAVANTTGTVSLAGNIGTASSYLNTLSFTKTGGKVTLADGKTSYITTLTTSSGSYGIVINNTSLTVTIATTFANTGALTLGNDGTTDACMFTNGVTHTAGATSLACALTTTNSTVTFGSATSTILLTKDTTVNTNNTTGGAVAFNGAITGAGLAVDAGSSTITFGSSSNSVNVSTTNSQSYKASTINISGTHNVITDGQSVTFVGAVVLLADSVVTATNGAITFSTVGTIDATTADTQGLTLSGGSGAITFGSVGSSKELKWLIITTSNDYQIPSAIKAQKLSVIANGAVTQIAANTGKYLFVKTLNDSGKDITLSSTNDYDYVILASLDSAGTSKRSGNITYTDSDGFEIYKDTDATPFISNTLGGICSGGVIVLTCGAAVTQSAPITGEGELLLLGTGPYTLNSLSTNNCKSLASSLTGSGNGLLYSDADAFSVTQVPASTGTSGITTNGGNVTLACTSGSITLSATGAVKTVTTGTDGGAITFSSPVIIANNTTPLTISTGTGSGDVTFSSTLNGTTAHTDVLTITAGSGNVAFGTSTTTGAVGNDTSLGAFIVTTTGSITAYNVVNADSITFGTVSGSGPINLYNTVTVSNANTAEFIMPVVILADATVTTGSAASGTISFDSTVNNDSSGTAHALSITAGTITFSRVVGGGNYALGAITINGGTVTIHDVGKTSASGATSLSVTGSTAVSLQNGVVDAAGVYRTSGVQTYNSNITLGTDTSFAADTVVFNGTVNGAGSLSVTGKTVVNTTTVNTSTTQSYNGAVTLGASTGNKVTTASPAVFTGTSISFGSTLSGSTTQTQSVTFVAGTSGATPTVVFAADVGSEALSLGAMTITGIATATDKPFVTTALTLVAGSFTQTGNNDTNSYKQSAGNITVTAGDMNWDNSNSGGSLSVGNITLTAGTLSFHNKYITIGGALDVTGSLTLLDLIVESTGSVTIRNGANLYVLRHVNMMTGSTFTNTGTGTFHLTNTTASSIAIKDGIIQDNTTSKQNFGDVEIVQGSTSKTFITSFNADTIDMSNTASTGKIDFEDALTVTALTNGTSTKFAITLNGTPSTARTTPCTTTITDACSINTTGVVTMGTLVGDKTTFTNGLTIPSASSVLLAGTIEVNTSGSPFTVKAPTSLSANTTVTTVDGALSFEKEISGTGNTLTVDAKSGVVSFGKTVGTLSGYIGTLTSKGSGLTQFNSAVYADSIAISGPAEMSNSSLNSKGTQVYSDKVTLKNDTPFYAFTSGVPYLVTFKSTVGSGSATGYTLQIGTAGTPTNVLFEGAVGGTANAVSLLSVTGDTTFGGSTALTVTTLGKQSYNGKVLLSVDTDSTSTGSGIYFYGTVDGGKSLTTTASSGISVAGTYFNGVVGGTTPLTTLTVIGPAILNSSAITTSGTQTFNNTFTVGSTSSTVTAGSGNGTIVFHDKVMQSVNGSVVFNAKVLLAASISFVKSDILVSSYSNMTFANTIDASSPGVQTLTVDGGTGKIIFNGALGGTTPLGAVTVTGGSTTVCSSITTSNAAITMNGAVVLNNSTGVSISSGTGTLTFNGTVDGTAVATDPLTVAADAVVFKGNVGHDKALGAVTLTCTTANIQALFYTGTGCALKVNNTGVLSIADTTSSTDTSTFDVIALGGFVQTVATGSAILDGDICTGNTQLSFACPITLNSAVQLSTQNTSGAGDITFGSAATINGASTSGSVFVLNAGTGSVTFNASVGDITNIASLSVTSCGAITCNKPISLAGNMSVVNSGLLLTVEDADITLASGSFTQSGTGTSQLAGSIITAGNNSITFATDVYVYRASATDSAQTIGGGTGAITVGPPAGSANWYVVYNSIDKTMTLDSPLVAKNIVLLGGTVTLGATGTNALTASADIVLLNGSADTMYADSATGLPLLYGYNNASPSRTDIASASLASFPMKCPDGVTSIPDGSTTAAYCGVVTGSSLNGRTLTAQQNFYDNGVALDGTASWSLVVKTNDNATNAFAELYNASITNCTVGATDSTAYAWLAAGEGCTDGGSNVHVGFSHPLINANGTYTVYDDVVRVSFYDSIAGKGMELKIENTNNEISKALPYITFNNGATAFSGAYVDAACATSVDGKGDISTFYLKTDGTAAQRWNTDATGMSSGSTESTDRGRTDVPAAHRSVVPNIDVSKATAALFHTLRDEHKNRIGNFTGAPTTFDSDCDHDGTNDANTVVGARFTGVTDHCAPVLVAVYAGQELHTEYNSATGASSQPEYDSHNFIEFQYSESVNVGDIPATSSDSSTYADVKNLRAENTFSSESEHGGAITNNASGVTVAGFATLASGEVYAGERTLSGTSYTGATSTTVHGLYRKFSTTAQASSSDTVQTHRMRVAIAGYVDGTVTANGKTYHNWNGYLNSSTIPSGAVSRIANSFITDVARSLDGTAVNTALASTDDTGDLYHPLPALTVNAYDVLIDQSTGSAVSFDSTTSLYGTWDSSRPEFALYMMKKTADSEDTDQVWDKGSTLYANSDGSAQFEVIGTTATTTSSYLDRVEFHLFDNTPKYSFTDDSYNWVSKNGWYEGEAATTPYEYAYDINGGSRGTSSKGNANRTSGGIRRSSLAGATGSFTYVSSAVAGTTRSFSTADMVQTGKSPFFYYSTDDTLATPSASDDSLYFALFLNGADTELPLTTTFDITFDDTTCFITDLAGNLITNTGSKKMASIDRVVPEFSLNVAAVGKDQLYMVFSKKLSSAIQDDFKIVADSLEFITMTSNPTSESATASDLSFTGDWKQVYETASVSCVVFTLNRAVTLSDIENTWVRVKKPSSTKSDPLTGVLAYVTPIQDNYGNYMIFYSCHALSDFAVNAVIPTYAQDVSEDTADSTETTADATTSLHRIQQFDGNGTNTNRVLTNCDLQLQVNIADARDSSNACTTETTNKAKVYFDSSITGTSADLYNKRTGADSEVWLPMALPSFNSTANAPENEAGLVEASQDETSSYLRYYTIHDKSDGSETDSFNWKGGQTIQFLFSMTDASGADITIDNDGDKGSQTEPIKLYALRLSNESDITSFDVWQFGTVTKKLQRGGVSIFNNVINPTKSEETVIQVDAEEGNLMVAVMTLDGNIVTYLEHSRVSAGTHYYRWNGKNNAGNSVARGLYFVRVVGEGIDETRKVMIVK